MKTIISGWGDIYIGSVSDGLKDVIDRLAPSMVVIVADENTARYCIPYIQQHLEVSQLMILPPGEGSKSLESCKRIWSDLISGGADRSALVLNVGGGMICDLGGFAAACYQRGVRFAHIPSSLLAMADAAIGGKTGIDFQHYKNYLGRIEAPSFIWIDPGFLPTLPEAEFRNGWAEIVKHAIIGDHSLWDMLDQLQDVTHPAWEGILEMNLAVKLSVIETDPYEKGLRKTLNFGHTIGHAVESFFLQLGKPVPHGGAVMTGMLVESTIANTLGQLAEEEFLLITGLILRLLGSSEVPLPPADQLIPWIQRDKKKSNGRTGFSLPERIGSCRWDIPVGDEVIADSISRVLTQGLVPSYRLESGS